MNILVEDWGGKYGLEISAKFGTNVEDFLRRCFSKRNC